MAETQPPPAAVEAQPNEGLRIALLVQLAGQAAIAYEQSGNDPRIKPMLDAAITQVTASGVLPHLLAMMARQPDPRQQQSNAREQERVEHQREFYDTLNKRRSNYDVTLKQAQELIAQLSAQLNK